uniref:Uncharacterized protein n=1 Tax=Ditylum brightwellii TaxID=49249 RepID=A0A7S4T3M3_9STRA
MTATACQSILIPQSAFASKPLLNHRIDRAQLPTSKFVHDFCPSQVQGTAPAYDSHIPSQNVHLVDVDAQAQEVEEQCQRCKHKLYCSVGVQRAHEHQRGEDTPHKQPHSFAILGRGVKSGHHHQNLEQGKAHPKTTVGGERTAAEDVASVHFPHPSQHLNHATVEHSVADNQSDGIRADQLSVQKIQQDSRDTESSQPNRARSACLSRVGVRWLAHHRLRIICGSGDASSRGRCC